MQFDQVARGVRKEKAPRIRAEPPVDDPIGHCEPVELRLRIVNRGDGAGHVGRRDVEFATPERGFRRPRNEVNLGMGTGVDPLVLAGAVPGHVIGFEAEDIAVEAQRRTDRVRTRRDPDREMVKFGNLERHASVNGSKISTFNIGGDRHETPCRPPDGMGKRASVSRL